MYFGQLKLKPFILETLKNLKINELTKIQEQVIPYVLNHHSVIVTSRTGSGKTLCYLIPILERINVEEKNTQAIIVVPTKELARQIYSKVNEFQKCCPKLKTLLLIGFGENDMERQKKSLINNPPHIIIGTVVKTLELLQQKAINKNIDILVLDEVDMFIDLGFMSQINKILDIVDTPKLQKIACSATTHESLANQLKNYFKDTKVISTSKTI
jgi:ATP-dependent RNA helicase CshB